MSPKTLRISLLSVISVLWIAGIAFMFAGRMDIGAALWGASFLAGFAVFLYQRHMNTLREVLEAEEKAAKAQKESEQAQTEKPENGENP